MRKSVFLLLFPLMLIIACDLEGPGGEKGEDGRDFVNKALVTEAINTALAAKTGGGAEPWIVKVAGVDLGDDYAVKNLFHGVAAGIEGDGSIALDLSECNGWTISYNAGIPLTDRDRYVSIILPESLTTIADGANGKGAFSDFNLLESVSAPGLLRIGSYAFYHSPKVGALNVPKLAAIGDYAFAGTADRPNTGLLGLDLPVTEIGAYAFYYCTGLETVSLLNVTGIGNYAFQFCGNLTGTLYLPEIPEIGQYVFENTALTGVDLPKATSIGLYAFRNCASLGSLNLPEVITISQNGFSGSASIPNTALVAIDLPKLESLQFTTFMYCTALKTVRLPSALVCSSNEFRYCTSLETVILGATPPSTGSNSQGLFMDTGNSGTITVRVPDAAAVAAYNAAGWITVGAETTGTLAAPKYGTNHKAVTVTTYE